MVVEVENRLTEGVRDFDRPRPRGGNVRRPGAVTDPLFEWVNVEPLAGDLGHRAREGGLGPSLEASREVREAHALEHARVLQQLSDNLASDPRVGRELAFTQRYLAVDVNPEDVDPAGRYGELPRDSERQPSFSARQ